MSFNSINPSRGSCNPVLTSQRSVSNSINSTGIIDVEIDGDRVSETIELLSDYKDRKIYAVYLLTRPARHSILGSYDHWTFKCIAQNLLITIEFAVSSDTGRATFNHHDEICLDPSLSNLYKFFYDPHTNEKFKKVLAIQPKFTNRLVNKFWKYRKNLKNEIDRNDLTPFLINFLEDQKHRKYFSEMEQIKPNISVLDIKKCIDEWRRECKHYNIVSNNCQSFVYKLLSELLEEDYPEELKNVAKKLESSKNRFEELKRIHEKEKQKNELNQRINNNKYDNRTKLVSNSSCTGSSSITTISLCSDGTSETSSTRNTSIIDENQNYSHISSNNKPESSKSSGRRKKKVRKRIVRIVKKRKPKSNPSTSRTSNIE